ncbi:hypothetical protein RFF05_01690 [Bengtsoniella intestinalis]
MLEQNHLCQSVFKHGEPTVAHVTAVWIELINTVEQNKSSAPFITP